MKQRGLSTVFAIWLVAAAIVCPLTRAQGNKTEPALKFKVGDVAPDFKMQYFDGSNLKDVSLSQYRDKSNVVVAFYVFAFTGG